MKVFIVSEKAYEIKQVRDLMARLPWTQYTKDVPSYYHIENPKAAIDKLVEDSAAGVEYHLAVVSQKMKVMPGTRFSRAINAREDVKAPPVLLIVDFLTKEVVQDAMAHGVSGFIELPFTSEGIQDTLSRLALTVIARARKKMVAELEGLKGSAPLDTFPELCRKIYMDTAAGMEKGAVIAPWSEDPHLELAYLYIEGGFYREAIPRLKAALRVNQENPDTHRSLLACYKKTGQSPEETVALKKALAANPANAELLGKVGDSLLREGNFREAALFFQKAIQNCRPDIPKRVRAGMHVGYGKTLMKEGDETGDALKHMEAKEQFGKALSVDPTLVAAYMNLLGAYRKLGMEAEARALLEKAVKITPDGAEGWMELFEYYLKEGEMQKARVSLDRAMQSDPENQITLIRGGEVYFHEGMYGEAAALFEKAGRINPSDTRICNFLGMTYRRMEMNEQAKDAFQKAIAIDKDDCNLFFNLARVYQQMGDAARARGAYETALKLNPDFAEARMALQSLLKNGSAAVPPKTASA